MQPLPLFPLRRVLVPGEMALLHVFEPRYRTMVAELDEERFGVVLIRGGREVGGGADFHDVGTLARIMEKRRLDDGRLLLVMVGEERFAVLDRLPEDPYPRGMVALLDEGDEDADAILTAVGVALRRYLVVSAESGMGGDIHFELSEDPVVASYQVASLLRLTSPERQELLEVATAQERLEREHRLLERETELLERMMQES